MDEFDALLDIALQALLARLKELLLVRADLAEDVFRFFGTRGLEKSSATGFKITVRMEELTPSSTGTEK